MTNTFTNALAMLWTSNPSARVQLRVNQTEWSKALSSGIQQERVLTEYGTSWTTTMMVRVLKSEEDERAKLKTDAIVYIRFADDEQWKRMRISNRHDEGGIIVLELITPDER